MKLLLDEMISGKVADRLRDRGFDVAAVTEDPALRGLSDTDIFAAAQLQGRAIVTYNRDDFLAIVRSYGHSGAEHHGLVIVNPTRHPNNQFSRLADSLGRLIKGEEPYPSFLVWLQ